MTGLEFAYIQRFILARTGIVLSEEKGYLVEVRLDPIVRAMPSGTFTSLVERLRAGDQATETAVIDAMTTNETLFFRDKSPFEIFDTFILPKLLAASHLKRHINIWCAACSSGQEPYSLSMMLEERKDELRGLSFKILATDISEKVLSQAREGIYSQFEVQRGLPIRLLLKYFTQVGTRWKIDQRLAERIEFRSINLLQPFRHLGMFNIILCRNVLIYFGTDTKRDVLFRLSENLSSDGHLLLGGAETVVGLTQAIAPHIEKRGLYVHAKNSEAYDISHMRQRKTS
jgi:chemotaxis protein methyltransferase CheR